MWGNYYTVDLQLMFRDLSDNNLHQSLFYFCPRRVTLNGACVQRTDRALMFPSPFSSISETA